MINDLSEFMDNASADFDAQPQEVKDATTREYERLRSAFAAGIVYGSQYYEEGVTSDADLDDAFGAFLMSELIKRLYGL